MDKSASQALLKKQKDANELSEPDSPSKQLKRNPSEAAGGMSTQDGKKEDSVGSAVKRKGTRGTSKNGSEGQNSRGSGSRIAKVPRDAKAEKVSTYLLSESQQRPHDINVL